MQYLDKTGLATLWSNIKTYVASQSGGSSSFVKALITTPADAAYGTNADGYTAVVAAHNNHQPIVLYDAGGSYYTVIRSNMTSGSTAIYLDIFTNIKLIHSLSTTMPSLIRITWNSDGAYVMSAQSAITYSYLFSSSVASDLTTASNTANPTPIRCNWVYNIVNTGTFKVDFTRAKSYVIPFDMCIILRNTSGSTVTVMLPNDSSVDNLTEWAVASGDILEMDAKYVNCSSSNISGDYRLFLRVL